MAKHLKHNYFYNMFNIKGVSKYVLFENLPQFDFGEFPYHPLETNTPTLLNGPTSRNPVDLNQMSVEARQLVHL
jgi:hypothetical protein